MIVQLEQQLKEAMIAKDEFAVSVLRGVIDAIRNREIELRGSGKELSEEECVGVLKREYKKRNESATLYRQGSREDLAQNEEKEAEFLKKFLPEQLSREAINDIVREVRQSLDDNQKNEFPIVMKAVMARVQSQADGSVVSQAVKEAIES